MLELSLHLSNPATASPDLCLLTQARWKRCEVLVVEMLLSI